MCVHQDMISLFPYFIYRPVKMIHTFSVCLLYTHTYKHTYLTLVHTMRNMGQGLYMYFGVICIFNLHSSFQHGIKDIRLMRTGPSCVCCIHAIQVPPHHHDTYGGGRTEHMCMHLLFHYTYGMFVRNYGPLPELSK